MANVLKKKWKSLVPLAAVIIIVSVLLRNNYYAQVLVNIASYSIVVSGLDLCFGYSGQISFGHAAFYCIGAYVSGLLSTKYHWPPFVAFILAILVAAMFGLFLSYPASKVKKHFLSLMTISFGWIVYTFVGAAKEITYGYQGFSIEPFSLFGYELKSMQSMFVFSTILLLIVLVIKRNILNSRIGRAFQAIRLNPDAANGLGINVRKYKMMAFTISAALAGTSGALFSFSIRYLNPTSFSATLSTLLMTMLLFGGIRSYVGPIIGAALLILSRDWLQPLGNSQALVYGILIILVLFVMPNGVAGLIDTVRNKVFRNRENRQGGQADA